MGDAAPDDGEVGLHASEDVESAADATRIYRSESNEWVVETG